jgi:alcohol oxidase
MGGTFTNVGKDFLDVAAKYDKERDYVDDVNGLFKCNSYGVSTMLTPHV